MKKLKSKTPPFSPTWNAQTIVCQICSEGFAIQIEIEDQPPLAAPPVLMKPPFRKGSSPLRLIFEMHWTSGLAFVSERSDQCHEPAERRTKGQSK
jgi:hypothetical protein